MQILFAHPNFPGQFVHLARWAANAGWRPAAVTDHTNQRHRIIPTETYVPGVLAQSVRSRAVLGYAEAVARAEGAATAALRLKRSGFLPDIILAHGAWGEGIYLKDIFPKARLVTYAELFRRSYGQNIGFDAEFDDLPADGFYRCASQNAPMLASMAVSDHAIAPTHWQADSFPDVLRAQIHVQFDGIDTQVIRPDPVARLALPNGRELAAGDPVITFVNRNLEPLRGVHIFLRALVEIQRAVPTAQAIVIGGDGVSYGAAPTDGGTWKARFLSELDGKLNLSRLHFLGRVPHQTLIACYQISAAHVYLTYPFVLSWSLVEAMAAGAPIIASDVAPVREFVTNGIDGTLVDFFDTAALAANAIAALEEPNHYTRLRDAARRKAVAVADLNTVCLPAQIELLQSFA